MTPYAYANRFTPPRAPLMGDIGANPVEWEIEPLDVPAADPTPKPAEPVTVPEREPVPA